LFIRGFDGRKKKGKNARALGSRQEESVKISTASFSVPSPSPTKGSSKGLDGGSYQFVKGEKQVNLTFGDGAETRPVNVALNYIIRAKP